MTKKIKILIAEDDKDSRSYVVLALKLTGIDVYLDNEDFYSLEMIDHYYNDFQEQSKDYFKDIEAEITTITDINSYINDTPNNLNFDIAFIDGNLGCDPNDGKIIKDDLPEKTFVYGISTDEEEWSYLHIGKFSGPIKCLELTNILSENTLHVFELKGEIDPEINSH